MKQLNFDMDALRTLVVGVDLGGFSHAALRLNRSPSAVSMQLRKLEGQAGQRLFKRDGRGLILTEAGDVLLQYARRVLSLNDEMGFAVGAIAKGGTIRVGMSQDFAHTILQPLLARYSKMRPQTHVEVKAGRNYELSKDVTSGRLDIALAFSSPGKSGANKVASLPTYWVDKSSRRGKFSRGEIVPLVVFDGPCPFRDMSIDALTQANKPWRLAMTTPSLASLWCGIRAGLGITVRTKVAVEPGLSLAPSKAGLPALPAIDVVLFCAKDHSAAVREFKDLLVGEVSKATA